MFNVCPNCGLYAAEKAIQPGEGWQAFAVCPECGYAHPFLRLPLFTVSGASGTGKTALALALAGRQDGPARNFVHMESDILWRAEFNSPQDNYHAYRNLWLRMCKNIGQAGKPVMLYGSVTPDQFESCPERRYFSQVFMLALVCAPEVLEARLRARPEWRRSGSESIISTMRRFNAWFLANAKLFDPPITLLDTSDLSQEETARFAIDWASKHWPAVGG